MKYSLLGRSNLKISEIGFGCMSLGNDQRTNEQLIKRAIAGGINFFDTADMYAHGANETELGRILKLRRKDIVLATKVGNVWKADGSGWEWNPRKNHILSAVEGSLQRLQTDHIDLYQLHGGTIEDPIDETIEAFEMLQQQGKILYYGISSIRPNVIREYVRRAGLVSVMMQYGLLDRRPEESCFELLHRNNIGILTRGSLAKGLLAGKPADQFLGYTPEQVKRAADTVNRLSGSTRSSSQTALRFALRPPMVTSAVVGIRTLEQLEDVLGTPDSTPLSTESLQTLRLSIPANTYDQHR